MPVPWVNAPASSSRESNHAFTVSGHYSGAMLCIAAITHLWVPRETEPNEVATQAHESLGHLGLTVIALVFVLLTFWKS
jgi:hypothetical protein